MQIENAIINQVVMHDMYISEVSEMSDLECVIQELKKYKVGVIKFMQYTN